MKLLIPMLLCLLAVQPAVGFLFSLLDNVVGTSWNTLRITWLKYNKMPLTVQEAKDAGFELADEGGPCDGNVQGVRYYDPNDNSVVILYDVNGFFAGIQAHYAKSLLIDEAMQAWFQQSDVTIDDKIGETETYSVTAYLVDPETICSTGRTKEDFDKTPSGTTLTFVTKGSPIETQNAESEIDQSVWTKGKCFWSMGVHYWYQTSEDMDCNDFKPIFVLYNRGVLTALGFAAFNKFGNTKHYEIPPTSSFAKFMDPVPKCLTDWSDKFSVSTMHVFMNTNPLNLVC